MTRTPKARALGGALRQARTDSGVKLRELAAKINRDPGVLSRWETGDRTPKPEHVAQVLTTLGVRGATYDDIMSLAYDTDAPLWVATSLPEQRQQLAALVDSERTARRITVVAPLLIPGLLQTEDYIRAIMSSGGVEPSEIVTRVAIRIARKEAITRENSVPLIAFVGEAALNQLIGDRQVMLEQFKYLLRICSRPNVTFRVFPFDSGWHPALEGAFGLIEPEQEPPVVQLENRRSGFFLHGDDDVTLYRDAIRSIGDVALTENESVLRVHEAINKIGTINDDGTHLA